VTADLAAAADAPARPRGDNDAVAHPPDPIDEAAALAGSTAAAVRRVLAGPDGPLAVACTLALVAMIEATMYSDEPGPSIIANLFATVPLVLVRTRLALAAGLIAFGVLFALSDADGALTIAGVVGLVIVLYLFADRYRRRWSAVLAFPFLLNAIWPISGDDPGFPSVLLLVIVVAALALGDSRKQRGQAIAERDESRRAMLDTLDDQAAMGERARIARDLHDVVAHHISAIAVQAESARLTTKDLPEAARDHLESIAQTARDALNEMRSLLGVLREDADAEPARDPQPGLARLGELIDTARAAGTEVRLTMSGEAIPLPPGVDLCAYRIVQEALTNARRHAPGATVDVGIDYAADTLRLRVRDDGPGPAASGSHGLGVLGMRERALMVGGTLTVGPADGGGFVVEAELPVRSALA
jgi:signal transduction histidine kinase